MVLRGGLQVEMLREVFCCGPVQYRSLVSSPRTVKLAVGSAIGSVARIGVVIDLSTSFIKLLRVE